jgi:hypothetical protein
MSQIIMLNHWLMMFLSPQSVRMDSKHFLAAEVLGLSSVNQPDKDIHGLSAAKHTLGLSVFNLNQPSKDVLSAVDQPHLDISAQGNQYDPLCHGIEHSVGAQKSLKKDDNTAAALGVGKQIHGYSIRNQFQSDVFVGTALVDMYAKCGSIRNVCRVLTNYLERLLSHGMQ